MHDKRFLQTAGRLVLLGMMAAGMPLLANALTAGSDASVDAALPVPRAPSSLHIIQPPALPPVRPAVIFHGRRDEKLVALTFDACSTRRPGLYDERIARVLVDKQVPATLFLGGKWIEENLAHTRYLASLPQFELGNHTYSHPHPGRVSDARLRREIALTQAVLYSVTGRQATLFRAPYGELDARTVQFAAQAGLTTVQYDLASGDPDPHAGKDALIRYVVAATRPGSIIVMHINRRGWHTAEALPEIIDALRRKGFRFVTVGALIARQKVVR